jgi:hypothetical protein
MLDRRYLSSCDLLDARSPDRPIPHHPSLHECAHLRTLSCSAATARPIYDICTCAHSCAHLAAAQPLPDLSTTSAHVRTLAHTCAHLRTVEHMAPTGRLRPGEERVGQPGRSTTRSHEMHHLCDRQTQSDIREILTFWELVKIRCNAEIINYIHNSKCYHYYYYLIIIHFLIYYDVLDDDKISLKFL